MYRSLIPLHPQGEITAGGGGGGGGAAEGEHPYHDLAQVQKLGVRVSTLSLATPCCLRHHECLPALAGSRVSHGSHGPGIANRTMSTPTPSNANETAAPSPATGRKMLRAMAEHDARTSTLPIHYQARLCLRCCVRLALWTSIPACIDHHRAPQQRSSPPHKLEPVLQAFVNVGRALKEGQTSGLADVQVALRHPSIRT